MLSSEIASQDNSHSQEEKGKTSSDFGSRSATNNFGSRTGSRFPFKAITLVYERSRVSKPDTNFRYWGCEKLEVGFKSQKDCSSRFRRPNRCCIILLIVRRSKGIGEGLGYRVRQLLIASPKREHNLILKKNS